MIATLLRLSRNDCAALKMYDAYSIHRVVYDLFPDIRTDKEKKSNISSGIIYADKGGNWNERVILILSNREPRKPRYGSLETKTVPMSFLKHAEYGFEVTMNPTKRAKATGKTIAIKGWEALFTWFLSKATQSWGFEPDKQSLLISNIGVKEFAIGKNNVTHNRATFIGKLRVKDREKFVRSFSEGIGRARGFGFGLLQLVPLKDELEAKTKNRR